MGNASIIVGDNRLIVGALVDGSQREEAGCAKGGGVQRNTRPFWIAAALMDSR